MNSLKQSIIFVFALGLSFLLSSVLLAPFVYASDTNGTIDPNNIGRQYAWGENIGWTNWQAQNGNVTVTDTALTGYVWSETYGWINLSPSQSGVTNNGEGVLGGYAWGESLGYIPFTGVTINSSGKFTGMAGTEGSTAIFAP